MASSHDKGRKSTPVISGEPQKKNTGRSQFLAGANIAANATPEERRDAERIGYNTMKGKKGERERKTKRGRRK